MPRRACDRPPRDCNAQRRSAGDRHKAARGTPKLRKAPVRTPNKTKHPELGKCRFYQLTR
eukprot:15294072-Alexandrium_andersonii.AAC.1